MLLKIRKNIDACDKELVSILSKRFALVKKVAEYKKKHSLKAIDPARFKEVLERVLKLSSKKKVAPEFAASLMNLIHKESLRIEEDVISKNEK